VTDPSKNPRPDLFRADGGDTDDHEREAVDALCELGLTGYEARVFVALQGLGAATARAISEAADVPRSQVYGAADDLADRGLVEVEHSSPKRYRPVGLDAVRAELTDRFERERARAFDALAAVREARRENGGQTVDGVATVHGREAVSERVERLLDRADTSVVHGAAAVAVMPPAVVDRLQSLAQKGVSVLVVSADPEVRARFTLPVLSTAPRTDGPPRITGRLLLVDDDAILISERPAGGSNGGLETAVWSADTDLAHVLVQFFRNGVQAVVGDEFDTGAFDGDRVD
jgi:sugar-specific transcriptional regulator TrmB